MWDYSVWSLFCDWHPSKAARVLWRLMLSWERPPCALPWCPRHQLSQTFPPCQYPTLKKNCFLFLLMAVTTHCCFFCVSVILFYNKVIIKGIQTLICWLLINVSMLHVGLESGDCFRETWKIGSFSNTKAEHSFPYPPGLLTGYISKV